jgi:hypothetical protein
MKWMLKTGIEELDQLLRGGFLIPKAGCLEAGPNSKKLKGVVVLIRGAAGTGKSTLAMQIARHAWWGWVPTLRKEEHSHDNFVSNLYCHYATLEQHLDQLNWSQRNRFSGSEDNKFKTDGVSYLEESTSGKVMPLSSQVPYAEINERVSKMEKDWKADGRRKRGSVMILDGLSIMTPDERLGVRFAELTERLRQLPGISVIVYEPTEGEKEILDHRVDVVIELEETHLTRPVPYTIHRMHILKTRYQESVLGWHQYKFGKEGLEFLPSMHFQVHRPRIRSRKPHPIGVVASHVPKKTRVSIPQGRSILEKLVGKLDEGDSIALLGPRGSFKTELSVDFLSATESGIESRSKKSLLVSLLGGGSKMKAQCPHAVSGRAKCSRPLCRLCNGQNQLLGVHQPPGCITPAEFLAYLRKCLLGEPLISRLAFWDLTQLDHRFPLLLHDSMFLPAFLEMLRGEIASEEKAPGTLERPVESLFMGAGNAHYTKAFSAIADNVVFCWRWSPAKNFWKMSPKSRPVKVPAAKTPNVKKPVSFDAPDYGGVRNIFYSKKSRNNSPPEFVLMYVDRTAGKFAKASKQLYAIPVEGTRLRCKKGAIEIFHIDFMRLQSKYMDEVRKHINKINQMQGVE